jgi:hypothetical protein
MYTEPRAKWLVFLLRIRKSQVQMSTRRYASLTGSLVVFLSPYMLG